MFWRYGAYEFPADENWFDIDARFVHSGIGRRMHSHIVVDLYGRRYAADKAALTTSLGDLENALAIDNQDLIFHDDDGTETRHSFKNDATINGVNVTGFAYLRRRSAGITGGADEYVISRTYRVRFEFDVINSEATILAWRESVKAIGTGQSDFVLMGAFFGPVQKQFTQQFTPFVAIQSGFALGHLSTPPAATPLFPADLKPTRHMIEPFTPKFGRVRNTEFGIRWNYVFESAAPLIATPSTF